MIKKDSITKQLQIYTMKLKALSKKLRTRKANQEKTKQLKKIKPKLFSLSGQLNGLGLSILITYDL